jgi:hypothetical protein
VVLRWRCKGTQRGELPVDVSGTAVYRFSSGKIVEEHNVWDTLLLMQQIGAVGELGHAKNRNSASPKAAIHRIDLSFIG